MKGKLHDNENFTNISYSAQKISDTEFDTCTFQNCDFSNSIFSETDFINCRFGNCNFSMVELNGSGLKNVQFVDCKLIGINFDHCSDFLFAANFQKCILDYSSFLRKKMKKAKFIDCSLKDVDFTEADLSMAIFDNCDLLNAVFQKSILEKADLRTALNYIFDPEANKIRKAKFSYSGVAGLLVKYNIDIE
jgi:uncharacterized protein YjbI with pentapeptide repeats